MGNSPAQSPRSKSADEPKVIHTDDGGSGLLEACKKRFPAPEYIVECDDRHTVWVKLADGTHSIGLPPWLLRRQSVEVTLAKVDAKLGTPGRKR